MKNTYTHNLYIGSGENGARLSKALTDLSKKHCHGNLGRFLIYTVCEKYRINPRTGERLKPLEKLAKC